MKVPSLPVMDVDAGYASIWPQLTEASRRRLRARPCTPTQRAMPHPERAPSSCASLVKASTPEIFVAWTESHLVEWKPMISERFLGWILRTSSPSA